LPEFRYVVALSLFGTTALTDPYADIRPYRDDEVLPVLARLLGDREFLDALASYRLGALARAWPALLRPLVRYALSRELRGVTDVDSMQDVIKRYMDHMIERSTAGFTVSGLDRLDPAQPYLYMSNHRDIAMDPAFTNYALYHSDRDTARIAIGDNLLTKPWVSDLMRLNKSFIVKRSITRPRELLAASKTLSGFIQHSLLTERVPVWMAQREGRAKDGIDRSEPAVIKMLSLSRDKATQTFAEHIASLRIVPVAISYELDPCDALKARELHQRATQGDYRKGEHEDVAAIGQGIAGAKGRVHVSFGTPLEDGLETADAVATAVDRQILAGYCLHPTNVYAYRRLYGGDAPVPADLDMEPGACSEAEFAARIEAMPAEHRPYALGIYANAIVARLALAPDASKPC